MRLVMEWIGILNFIRPIVKKIISYNYAGFIVVGVTTSRSAAESDTAK